MHTREELEALVVEDYERLVHQTVRVRALFGWVGGVFLGFHCPGAWTTVRICPTRQSDLLRYLGDGWISPMYRVVLVHAGELREARNRVSGGTLPEGCWIHGPARHLDERRHDGNLAPVNELRGGFDLPLAQSHGKAPLDRTARGPALVDNLGLRKLEELAQALESLADRPRRRRNSG